MSFFWHLFFVAFTIQQFVCTNAWSTRYYNTTLTLTNFSIHDGSINQVWFRINGSTGTSNWFVSRDFDTPGVSTTITRLLSDIGTPELLTVLRLTSDGLRIQAASVDDQYHELVPEIWLEATSSCCICAYIVFDFITQSYSYTYIDGCEFWGLDATATPAPISPTNYPSVNPSLMPTLLPSIQPSNFPSIDPTAVPSVEPSIQPSNYPTVEPSVMPSDIPSIEPSVIPSNDPSVEPTLKPSGVPSGEPSTEPTELPSSQPSTEPSSQPSGQPSKVPSHGPTDMPSIVPSFEPSTEPTTMTTQGGKKEDVTTEMDSDHEDGNVNGSGSITSSGDNNDDLTELIVIWLIILSSLCVFCILCFIMFGMFYFIKKRDDKTIQIIDNTNNKKLGTLQNVQSNSTLEMVSTSATNAVSGLGSLAESLHPTNINLEIDEGEGGRNKTDFNVVNLPAQPIPKSIDVAVALASAQNVNNNDNNNNVNNNGPITPNGDLLDIEDSNDNDVYEGVGSVGSVGSIAGDGKNIGSVGSTNTAPQRKISWDKWDEIMFSKWMENMLRQADYAGFSEDVVNEFMNSFNNINLTGRILKLWMKQANKNGRNIGGNIDGNIDGKYDMDVDVLLRKLQSKIRFNKESLVWDAIVQALCDLANDVYVE